VSEDNVPDDAPDDVIEQLGKTKAFSHKVCNES
jgi:hypothetical protein